jgi:hypothetical protein
VTSRISAPQPGVARAAPRSALPDLVAVQKLGEIDVRPALEPVEHRERQRHEHADLHIGVRQRRDRRLRSSGIATTSAAMTASAASIHSALSRVSIGFWRTSVQL